MSTTALTFAVRDSATMLRRDFRRSLRYPLLTIRGLTVSSVNFVDLLLCHEKVFSKSATTRKPPPPRKRQARGRVARRRPTSSQA
jgi:hypothetical protein